MKLYATIENEKGKSEGVGGNEYLDIDIKVKNKYLARFTVREKENGDIGLFDEWDNEVAVREQAKKQTGEICEDEENAEIKRQIQQARK